MPRRPSKDPNVAGFDLVARATGSVDERPKNPAAVALGRLGGAKGGKARAAKLSKRRLSEIGRKGAQKRWAAAKRTK